MLWWTRQQLRSSNPQVRARAARKLGEAGSRRSVPSLIRALADETASVRIEVAKALSAYEHPAAVEPLAKALGRAKAAGSARAALDKASAEAECEALAKALARQGTRALGPLVKLLKEDEREVRRWAAYGLGLIKSTEAVKPLAVCLDDSRSEVRKSAALALGEIGDPGVLVPLEKALVHRDPDTRKAAAEALGSIGSEDSVEALASAAGDSNDGVQLAAIEALRKIGGLSAGISLRKTMDAGGKRAVIEAAKAGLNALEFRPANAVERSSAAVLVGDFKSAIREGLEAEDALIETLASRDSVRRRDAALALGAICSAKAIPALLNALKDYDREAREAAADALAGIGTPAFEGLKKSLESPDAEVQCLAARALGQIGDARAVGALAETIKATRGTTSSYLEPLEAARAAAAALSTILTNSPAAVSLEDLEKAASVPDAMLEHPEGRTEESRRPELVVDCAPVRALARSEQERRGLV